MGCSYPMRKITFPVYALIFDILLCKRMYLQFCYGYIKSGTKDEMSLITRFVTRAATKNNESNLVTAK